MLKKLWQAMAWNVVMRKGRGFPIIAKCIVMMNCGCRVHSMNTRLLIPSIAQDVSELQRKQHGNGGMGIVKVLTMTMTMTMMTMMMMMVTMLPILVAAVGRLLLCC